MTVQTRPIRHRSMFNRPNSDKKRVTDNIFSIGGEQESSDRMCVKRPYQHFDRRTATVFFHYITVDKKWLTNPIFDLMCS